MQVHGGRIFPTVQVAAEVGRGNTTKTKPSTNSPPMMKLRLFRAIVDIYHQYTRKIGSMEGAEKVRATKQIRMNYGNFDGICDVKIETG